MISGGVLGGRGHLGKLLFSWHKGQRRLAHTPIPSPSPILAGCQAWSGAPTYGQEGEGSMRGGVERKGAAVPVLPPPGVTVLALTARLWPLATGEKAKPFSQAPSGVPTPRGRARCSHLCAVFQTLSWAPRPPASLVLTDFLRRSHTGPI